MGLKKNSETKEYSKDPEVQTELLKPIIQDLWYKGVDLDSSDSDNEAKKKGKGEKIDGEDDEESEDDEGKQVQEIDIHIGEFS